MQSTSSSSSNSKTIRLLAAVREAQIARAVARAVFAVFAAEDRVAVEVTLHYEAIMQAAALELRHAFMQRYCEAAGVALATTAAK